MDANTAEKFDNAANDPNARGGCVWRHLNSIKTMIEEKQWTGVHNELSCLAEISDIVSEESAKEAARAFEEFVKAQGNYEGIEGANLYLAKSLIHSPFQVQILRALHPVVDNYAQENPLFALSAAEQAIALMQVKTKEKFRKIRRVSNAEYDFLALRVKILEILNEKLGASATPKTEPVSVPAGTPATPAAE